MPTYEPSRSFKAGWRRLDPAQQAAFLRALKLFLEGLPTGVFHPSLRVKGYKSTSGVFELTWAPDGRALWRYGVPPPGLLGPHIEWLRIGTHKIFD